MKKVILIFLSLILFQYGQTQIIDPVYISKTINVQVAGTLSTLISDNEINRITKLTLTGNIDARDIRLFYSIYNLSELDLSDANIMEYIGVGGVGPDPYTEKLYPANEMPNFSICFLDFNLTLTTLILPKSLKSIASLAFYNCRNLTNLSMYDSLISIGENAFNECGALTNITIPKNVTFIASSAFTNCLKILTYSVNTENLKYKSLDGVLYDKNMTVLYAYPSAKVGDFSIPETITSIGNSAFCNCTNLTNIVIPNSVTEIGAMAFMRCTAINSIVIPNKVKRINNNCFQFCNYLSAIKMPDSLQYIGDYAFSVCEFLSNIVIPKKVSYIGNYAFAQCTNLSSITLPDSIKTFGEWMFNSCINLKEIIIPDAVDSIKYGAFQSCNKLQNLKIGKNVTYIDSRCFVDCVSLKSIYAYPTKPVDLSLSADVFLNVNKTNCVLYVPINSKAAYMSANQWKDFKIIEEMTTGLQLIDEQPDISYHQTDTQLKITSSLKTISCIEIYAISGKKIMQEKRNNENTVMIEIGNLSKGIYLLRSSFTDNTSYLNKWIKE